MVYKRLPLFYLCCGHIRHTYEEYGRYKGRRRINLLMGYRWRQSICLGNQKKTEKEGKQIANQPTKTKYQDHSGNSSLQQQQQLQWNRDTVSRSGPSS